jgi:hypothetical protein
MRELNESIRTFREAARHLWNSAFRTGADWDARDRFSTVCAELFDAVVLAPAGTRGVRLPPMNEPEPAPLTALRVVPDSDSGIPIQINRSSPPSGYWDDPVDRVSPADVVLQFVRFHDFDELGLRDFEYLEVRIDKFLGQPHLVGRRALVACRYVTVCAVDAAPAAR